jgi:hypothetical protein
VSDLIGNTLECEIMKLVKNELDKKSPPEREC